MAPSPREAASPSLYDVVDERLARLVKLLGLRTQAETIHDAFQRLCSESLALPLGSRPMRPSRLNADGTPFQFALTLGAGPTPLQFLSETGPQLATNADRLASAHTAIEELAHQLGVAHTLTRTRALLEMLLPGADRELLSDEAGAMWLGASFSPQRGPRLKIYVNLKWGKERARRARLEAFAASAGLSDVLQRLDSLAAGTLEPLGVSLDLAADRPSAGRMYMSGYGRRVPEYERLVGAFDPALSRALKRYCDALLGDDRHRPTRSVVVSFGAHPGSRPECKLELCAHCALPSDAVARERSLAWLDEIGASREPYLGALDALSDVELSRAATLIHVYLGIGSRGGNVYSTFYLNPAGAVR